VAENDAFDSVLALSQMRAVSYDANADESRYLVDPARAGQYRQWRVIPPLAVALTIVLIVAGIWPRLAEYR
jgi:hypothetical protein